MRVCLDKLEKIIWTWLFLFDGEKEFEKKNFVFQVIPFFFVKPTSKAAFIYVFTWFLWSNHPPLLFFCSSATPN
jgi:hypothetical protein